MEEEIVHYPDLQQVFQAALQPNNAKPSPATPTFVTLLLLPSYAYYCLHQKTEFSSYIYEKIASYSPLICDVRTFHTLSTEQS